MIIHSRKSLSLGRQCLSLFSCQWRSTNSHCSQLSCDDGWWIHCTHFTKLFQNLWHNVIYTIYSKWPSNWLLMKCLENTLKEMRGAGVPLIQWNIVFISNGKLKKLNLKLHTLFDLVKDYTDIQSMMLLHPPYSKSQLQVLESSADCLKLGIHFI